MKLLSARGVGFIVVVTLLLTTTTATASVEVNQKKEERRNVLFIVCDDLNDYIETMGGHPQAQTPHIRRLVESSVSFTEAHATIPLCGPSRTSFLSGLHPHSSKQYEQVEVSHIGESTTSLIKFFGEHGYRTMGAGKIMHGHNLSEWSETFQPRDRGPYAFWRSTGANEVHPDVQFPFRSMGVKDGSFGPLRVLEGEEMGWRTGDALLGYREIRYKSETDRDPTADELNAAWVVEKLQELDEQQQQQNYANTGNSTARDEPFFLGIGFLRPHTPLVVPQKYFDMYPIETLEPPLGILKNDNNDTFRDSLGFKFRGHDTDRGSFRFQQLIKSYENREESIKRFLQAYLASISSIDDLVGQILTALDSTTRTLKDNTVVVFTSDHGFEIGQKEYLGKNTLWQPSTRVPYVWRVPGITPPSGGVCDQPVSLVDLYPTLIDVCGISTRPKTHRLDGTSLKPLLCDPQQEIGNLLESWDGPEFALTALSRKPNPTEDKFEASHALRYKDWRYIRYANGKEELYDTRSDPYEFHNLLVSDEGEHDEELLSKMRLDLSNAIGK